MVNHEKILSEADAAGLLEAAEYVRDNLGDMYICKAGEELNEAEASKYSIGVFVSVRKEGETAESYRIYYNGKYVGKVR